MKAYQELSREELISVHEELLKEYDAWKEKDLSLNMARGKPSSAQLDLTNDIMTVLGHDDYYSEDGTDLRNYGILDGICEAKKLADAAGMKIDFQTVPAEKTCFPDETFDVITACQCF